MHPVVIYHSSFFHIYLVARDIPSRLEIETHVLNAQQDKISGSHGSGARNIRRWRQEEPEEDSLVRS